MKLLPYYIIELHKNQVSNYSFLQIFCRFTIDVLHSKIFFYEINSQQNISVKKEYGSFLKCVIGIIYINILYRWDTLRNFYILLILFGNRLAFLQGKRSEDGKHRLTVFAYTVNILFFPKHRLRNFLVSTLFQAVSQHFLPIGYPVHHRALLIQQV